LESEIKYLNSLFGTSNELNSSIIFLNLIQKAYGYLSEYIVVDTGYGSEPNYMAIIDDFNRTPLITYGMFLKNKNIKLTSLIHKIRNMTKLIMNTFVQIIND